MSTILNLLALALLGHSVTASQGPFLPEVVYHGRVTENGGLVEVYPGIQAENGPICGFRIVNTDWGNIPFEIFMKSAENGTAELKARHPLDCERKDSYVLTIAAVACNGHVSPSREINVLVDDVNEYIPVWSEQEYAAQVEEGKLEDFILEVSASDNDCSSQFGDVCNYRITGSDQTFAIDHQGIISNTRPLNTRESRVHVISVVATDCGGKESSPVLVTITVIPTCRTEWTDVSTSMTYIPGTGPQPTFPVAQLRVCPSLCPLDRLETRLTLHTQHPAETCDRDTYSLDMMRKMCGASNMAVELLTEAASEFQRPDSTTEGSSVYQFDGVSGAIVPSGLVRHDLGQEFTIATWLKHGKKRGKQTKEQILCVSDDHRKNRHHTALFVRNCKLVLLYRRDYDEQERNVFKPAEWRWSVPQVCDNTWHHYAVSLSPEGAQLFLDGELFDQEGKNTEIIDDWPLHPAAEVQTTLTVGACWHGSDVSMKHGLQGELAGLSVLPGRREHSEVLKCLVQCSESLQLPATNLLQPGMEMVTNSHGSQVTIDGDNVDNMNQLVRQVAYLNTREFPASGRRKLELETEIHCSDGTKQQVPLALSSILVLTVPQPIITITGTENMSREYESFKKGVRIFADIKVITSRDEADIDLSEDLESELDRCSVTVFPPLNPDHETIHLPEAMLQSLNIAGAVSNDGIEIVGTDMVYNYEQILRQVTYNNLKPAYYLNRQFKLSCSVREKRFISNEFTEMLTVIHPVYSADGSDSGVSHQQMSRFSANLPSAHFLTQTKAYISPPGPEQGNAVVVVVIVSMGLLVTVLAVGIVRLRAAASSEQNEDQELEMGWEGEEEDEGPNITVNPLERKYKAEIFQDSMTGGAGCHQLDSDMEDGLVTEYSDEEMYDDYYEEDEEMDETKERLAWDKDV